MAETLRTFAYRQYTRPHSRFTFDSTQLHHLETRRKAACSVNASYGRGEKQWRHRSTIQSKALDWEFSMTQKNYYWINDLFCIYKVQRVILRRFWITNDFWFIHDWSGLKSHTVCNTACNVFSIFWSFVGLQPVVSVQIQLNHIILQLNFNLD